MGKINSAIRIFIILALFIRKHILSTFLSEKEMSDNQKSVESKTVRDSVTHGKFDDEMSYFDYLLKYIGIDRENLPENIVQLYHWGGSHISEFSWWFNEIVYFSMGKQFYHNEMRAFYHQPTIHPDQCQELLRLRNTARLGYKTFILLLYRMKESQHI